MPPSTDPAMYPPLRPASRPRPYVELHGFAAFWLVPATDTAAPHHASETFRLRWAVIRLDAHPAPQVHLLTRLGLMLENPLLDLSISWTELPFLNLTVGQMRLPLGASATTLAPMLVMLDRPGYVYAMTKATFRDLGVMVGSGEEGLAGGTLHYRAGVFAGNGRILEGDPSLLEDAADLLWIARAIADLGPLIGPAARLALGAELAWTRDPALDITDVQAARASAANHLGRLWTPFDRERETMLAGADLTLSIAGLWLQLEWLFLESRPTDGTPSRRSTGGSTELAYTLPWRLEGVAFQPAARGEIVDPDLDRARDEYAIATGGLNIMPLPFLRLSTFGGATFYRDASTGAERVGGELSVRAAMAY